MAFFLKAPDVVLYSGLGWKSIYKNYHNLYELWLDFELMFLSSHNK